MITLHKTPNDDSEIIGGPKSAFKCVQRRCRSPATLSTGSDMRMTNNIVLPPPSVIKHADIFPSEALRKHTMFPQFCIPSNLLCPTSQQEQHDEKIDEKLVKLRNNNNSNNYDYNSEDTSLKSREKNVSHLAKLANVDNSVSSKTDNNSRYNSFMNKNGQNQMPIVNSNALNQPHETILEVGRDSGVNGLNSLTDCVSQKIGFSNTSNIMYQTIPEEECIFGTRVPATTESEKCHQRARVMMQHNQSTEKIRRYK